MSAAGAVQPAADENGEHGRTEAAQKHEQQEAGRRYRHGGDEHVAPCAECGSSGGEQRSEQAVNASEKREAPESHHVQGIDKET